MGTKNELNADVEKYKYFNRLDEAFRILFLSISRDILFQVETITKPKDFGSILSPSLEIQMI